MLGPFIKDILPGFTGSLDGMKNILDFDGLALANHQIQNNN